MLKKTIAKTFICFFLSMLFLTVYIPAASAQNESFPILTPSPNPAGSTGGSVTPSPNPAGSQGGALSDGNVVVDFRDVKCSKLITDNFNVGKVIQCYVDKTFNFIIAVSLVVSVAMIIAAGFMYITASGNPEKIKIANSALKGAVIGLIIVILSWSIAEYVQSLSMGQTSPVSSESNLAPSSQPAGQTGGGITPGTASPGTLPTVDQSNSQALSSALYIIFPPVYKDSAKTSAIQVKNPTDYWTCENIRETIKQYYPDANVWGEGSSTYYIKGIELVSNPATAIVYYKKTANSTTVYSDMWNWESSSNGATNWYKIANRNGIQVPESAIKNTCPRL